MITGSCIIRDFSIFKDGQLLFRDASGSLAQFATNAYLFLKIDYPKFYKMDLLSQLGFLAAEVLTGGHKLGDVHGSENVSLVLSNAHASLDTDRRYWQSTKTVASPALFVYTLPNIVAGEICIRHHIKGENAFFISDGFDATLITEYVAMVPSPVCLAGWVDVLSEQHDVFLYLWKRNEAAGKKHDALAVNELYQNPLWNS